MFAGADQIAHFPTSTEIGIIFQLSCGEQHLSTRVDTWERAKVPNITLHALLTSSLPQRTYVYRASGLVNHFKPKLESHILLAYFEEEYLILSKIETEAFLGHFPGGGYIRLFKLPTTRSSPISPEQSVSSTSQVLIPVLQAWFDRCSEVADHVALLAELLGEVDVSGRNLSEADCELRSKCFINSFSHGTLFSYEDLYRYISNQALSDVVQPVQNKNEPLAEV